MITKKIKNTLKKSKWIVSTYHYIKDGWKRYWIQHFGLKVIGEVTSVLNENGITAFADFGTLLGIIRDNHLLGHDKDIDIGIIGNGDMVSDAISQILCPLSYKLVREFTFNGKTKEQSYRKKHIRIDLQFYEIEQANEKMLCYLFHRLSPESKTWYAVEKRCRIAQSLHTKDVEGVILFVPQNAEELLLDKYGDNWRIPNKGFHFWEAPNTVMTEHVGCLKTF